MGQALDDREIHTTKSRQENIMSNVRNGGRLRSRTPFLLASCIALAACGAEEQQQTVVATRSSSLASLQSERASSSSRGRSTRTSAADHSASPTYARGEGRPNTVTDFVTSVTTPRIDAAAYVDAMASVIGDVELGPRVYLAPFSSARGDEGVPIHIGGDSNLQDGVVVHALETFEHGNPRPEHTYLVNGKRYAVFVGDRVSLAHQSHVHGPAWIENDVFLGMQSLVFKAHIEAGVVVEPACTIIGVTIPAGRYVPAGSVITSQAQADALPRITQDYGFRTINEAVVHVNTSLADGYSGKAASSEGH